MQSGDAKSTSDGGDRSVVITTGDHGIDAHGPQAGDGSGSAGAQAIGDGNEADAGAVDRHVGEPGASVAMTICGIVQWLQINAAFAEQVIAADDDEVLSDFGDGAPSRDTDEIAGRG